MNVKKETCFLEDDPKSEIFEVTKNLRHIISKVMTTTYSERITSNKKNVRKGDYFFNTNKILTNIFICPKMKND